MHPSTTALLRHFAADHLPERLQRVSLPCGRLALDMAEVLPSSAELTAGIRKLLEAKDCFVRAALYAPEPEAAGQTALFAPDGS